MIVANKITVSEVKEQWLYHTGRSWNVVVSLPSPLHGCLHAKLALCRIRYCWSPPDTRTTTLHHTINQHIDNAVLVTFCQYM